MNKDKKCPQCGYVHLGAAKMIAHIFKVIGYKDGKGRDTLSVKEIKAIYDYLSKPCRITETKMLEEQFKCDHCGLDTRLRNPSGFCDHLHYPENCVTCRTMLNERKKENERT